jgi:hypothetical protein
MILSCDYYELYDIYLVFRRLKLSSRRAGLAINFSTGRACASHAFGVLGVCVVITAIVRFVDFGSKGY